MDPTSSYEFAISWSQLSLKHSFWLLYSEIKLEKIICVIQRLEKNNTKNCRASSLFPCPPTSLYFTDCWWTLSWKLSKNLNFSVNLYYDCFKLHYIQLKVVTNKHIKKKKKEYLGLTFMGTGFMSDANSLKLKHISIRL